MDGLTYNAKVDTTTGHITLDDNNEGVTISTVPKMTTDTNWDNSDLLSLRNQFSELEDLI
jgi:hypothetical protein